MLAALFAFAASATTARTRSWIVSGSITGTYSNDVTWVNCLDHGPVRHRP